MKSWIRILSIAALVLGVASGAWAKGDYDDDGGKSKKSRKNPCAGITNDDNTLYACVNA